MNYLFQNKYWRLNEEYNLDKLLYLMVDRPNTITNYNFIWTNKENQIDRDYDLPSYIIDMYDNVINNIICELCWDKNNKQHRTNNKPAVITFDGYKRYYINDKFIKREKPK